MLYPAVEEGITLEWDRKGVPGKLSFSAVKDAALDFEEGDPVKLTVDGTDMFYGFVFARSRSGSSSETVKVTAYDQLRYFKNKDTYVYADKTAAEVIKMLAEDFHLQTGELADTEYKIASRTEDNVTLFDIVQNALDETLSAKGKLYVLYDDVGRLTLRDVENMKLGLLYDAQTLGDYDYGVSIDTQTYNQIKITCENKETGARDVFMTKHGENIERWGLLQHTDTVETSTGGAAKAEALLKLYNSETRSLSVSDALGDVRVRPGSSVIVKLDLRDMMVQSFLMIEQVKHTFKNNEHLMSMKLRGGKFVT